MSWVDGIEQIFRNVTASSPEEDRVLSCANEMTSKEVASGKENDFSDNYRFCKAMEMGGQILHRIPKPGLHGSPHAYTETLHRQVPKELAHVIKIDPDFKFIPNGPSQDPNRGKIFLLKDALVIKVLQPDGKTWASRGMTVEEFLHHPWVDPKTGQRMRTPADRVAFLRRVTNRLESEEIKKIVKSTFKIGNTELTYEEVNEVMKRAMVKGGVIAVPVLNKQNP